MVEKLKVTHKETLKTDELYIEVCKRNDGLSILNISHNQDEDMFIEAYFSDREMKDLIKMLTRVNIGLKAY